MNPNLARALRGIAGALDALEQRYAVIGGIAVSALTEPRFTRDLDLAVLASSDAEAENVIFALLQRGYVTMATIEHERTGRLATVRLKERRAQPEDPIVDLLFASCGIEPETVEAAGPLPVLGTHVAVARRPHLIAMKTLARDDIRRPLDRADLIGLLRGAEPGDVEEAERLLGLVVERGYGRDKDLLGELRRLIAELRAAGIAVA